MQKAILIILTAVFFFASARACDICGCGVGNSYIGILPDFSKQIFGLRYRQNSLLTHVGVGGSASCLTTKEHYRTLEAWGAFNLGKKFRIMAAVPYSFNKKINQGSKMEKAGLGDFVANGYYELISNRKTTSNKLLVQSLWIGGGIKVPTGKYNPVDKSNSAQSANLFQLGTGSTDFTLNGMYDIRLQDAGISASGSYKVNTTNKFDYRYGNKLSCNIQAYYKIRVLKTITIAPNTGTMHERAQKDMDHKLTVDLSGGNLLMGTIGAEITFKTFAIGSNFQTPFSQNLAQGILKANSRGMVHISFLL